MGDGMGGFGEGIRGISGLAFFFGIQVALYQRPYRQPPHHQLRLRRSSKLLN